MAQVLVRKLDEKTVEMLKERARSQGRSLQAELRLILAQAAGADSEKAKASATRVRETQHAVLPHVDPDVLGAPRKILISTYVLENVLEDAERAAREADSSLAEVIEDALRMEVARRRTPRQERVKLPTFRGELQPGVDLDNSAALLDIMEGLDDPS
ncbi:MAG TPA: hypothetical protein VFI91_03780 [Longimicrobiaceae bacterium]|nr:hypothetical protein [Longimicrobiaceae bacterium]